VRGRAASTATAAPILPGTSARNANARGGIGQTVGVWGEAYRKTTGGSSSLLWRAILSRRCGATGVDAYRPGEIGTGNRQPNVRSTSRRILVKESRPRWSVERIRVTDQLHSSGMAANFLTQKNRATNHPRADRPGTSASSGTASHSRSPSRPRRRLYRLRIPPPEWRAAVGAHFTRKAAAKGA
jgi:hypothetical protein